MPKSILTTYNKILGCSIDIQAAIKEKDWERVNILASHREELIQQTNAFVFESKDVEESLKKEIIEILQKIKEVDDDNFKIINEDRTALEATRRKVNIGQKALNAYQKKLDANRCALDEHM